MVRTVLSILIIICITLSGGAWSVDYILKHFEGFGHFKIGQWSAYPKAGTEQDEPYSRARFAKNGIVSLGQTEGLAFQLWNDSNNRPLKSHCTYRLYGLLPEARLFTLYTVNETFYPLKIDELLPFSLHSNNIIFRQDENLSISISPNAQPYNWLATSFKDMKYGLILTLYDTQILTNTPLNALKMPSVDLVLTGEKGCE
ncbi:DUF1214 domain-containing protein [Bartonella tamiae]|uniref:DUF1214 domain-containing protein n=1 Tax=Bartonella tamiae Th239 TaxID=1094558 RepID=J0QX10_9HYPH|nr:DUF1214 domain-containing protein [Bartonella tamiae]EJF90576.1 hypothetical protein ME5_00977 [Bartonella tamiae Th239]EJF94046.1 hypothetical protein MEG_00904 [Bartonella tamiae Th307]